VKFRAHQEVHALLEMPRISPPMFLGQSISFGDSLDFCLREVKNIPELFFKEEGFFDRGSLIDLNHFRDEEMVFFGPSIHVFQKTPFHLPEFLSVKDPTFSLQRLSILDQGIFEVVAEPLHDMEEVVLKGGFRPYL